MDAYPCTVWITDSLWNQWKSQTEQRKWYWSRKFACSIIFGVLGSWCSKSPSSTSSLAAHDCRVIYTFTTDLQAQHEHRSTGLIHRLSAEQQKWLLPLWLVLLIVTICVSCFVSWCTFQYFSDHWLPWMQLFTLFQWISVNMVEKMGLLCTFSQA